MIVVPGESVIAKAVSNSKGRSPREERAVDGVDNRLGADLTSAEETAIETLDGVFPASHTVEFEVNVALGIRI